MAAGSSEAYNSTDRADAQHAASSCKQTPARAEELARSHRLPLDLARRVVEGEMGLHAALMLKPSRREAESRGQSAPVPKGGTAASHYRLGAGALSVLALLTLVALRPGASGPADADHEALFRDWAASAEITRNSAGTVQSVSGPTPQSVLAGFCSAYGHGHQVPVELRLPAPPRAGLRIGLFRESSGDGPLRAVRIERRQREWFIGGGEEGIVIQDAPARIPGTPGMPVAALRRDP
jgi:hypothetical protein